MADSPIFIAMENRPSNCLKSYGRSDTDRGPKIGEGAVRTLFKILAICTLSMCMGCWEGEKPTPLKRVDSRKANQAETKAVQPAANKAAPSEKESPRQE